MTDKRKYQIALKPETREKIREMAHRLDCAPGDAVEHAVTFCEAWEPWIGEHAIERPVIVTPDEASVKKLFEGPRWPKTVSHCPKCDIEFGDVDLCREHIKREHGKPKSDLDEYLMRDRGA